MLEDTGFYIDDVCIPQIWFPIETDVNEKPIFKLNFDTTRVATIPRGHYSVNNLAIATATAMSATIGTEHLESEYPNTTNALKIKLKILYGGSLFTIYTDATLNQWCYLTLAKLSILTYF